MIRKDCKSLRSRAALIEAIKLLPEDVTILAIEPPPPSLFQPDSYWIKFTSEMLGDREEIFRIVTRTEIKMEPVPPQGGFK